MEAQYSDHEVTGIISKGKRTKRQRPVLSPLALSMAPTASSSCSSDNNSCVFDRVTTTSLSPSKSAGKFTGKIEEEEDMAKCLILLAKGRAEEKGSCSRIMAGSSSNGKPAGGSGVDVYQCKTCNKCFPSFQALGGHRASHKKPKPPAMEETQSPNSPRLAMISSDRHHETTTTTTTLSLQMPIASRGSSSSTTPSSKSNKIHECSICGAEFNSGQALGGHMRRHRPLLMAAAAANSNVNVHHLQIEPDREVVVKKPRSSNTLLSLDLNLPAPEEDHGRDNLKFPFPSSNKEQVLVFSASSLVDCHY